MIASSPTNINDPNRARYSNLKPQSQLPQFPWQRYELFALKQSTYQNNLPIKGTLAMMRDS